jgi:hypothetical protein
MSLTKIGASHVLMIQCAVMMQWDGRAFNYQWTPNPVALGIVALGALMPSHDGRDQRRLR